MKTMFLTAALVAAVPLAAQGGLEAPVKLTADGVVIDTDQDVAHAGPTLADLDGDGDLDLLVGNFRGTIRVYRNVGTAQEPAFSGEGKLQAEGKEIRIHNW